MLQLYNHDIPKHVIITIQSTLFLISNEFNFDCIPFHALLQWLGTPDRSLSISAIYKGRRVYMAKNQVWKVCALQLTVNQSNAALVVV